MDQNGHKLNLQYENMNEIVSYRISNLVNAIPMVLYLLRLDKVVHSFSGV